MFWIKLIEWRQLKLGSVLTYMLTLHQLSSLNTPLITAQLPVDSENGEEIILIEWGDHSRINPNEAAVELVTWLSGVFAKAGCPGMGKFDSR